MSAYFCSVYDGSGTVWPTQPFPGNLFPGWSSQRRLEAQTAWNFFELVESTDAATRVSYSNQGGWTPPAASAFAQNPSLWYPLFAAGAKTLYQKGQLLHEQACPNTNWSPQRTLGIPKTPLANVYPGPSLH
jgi:hypothetical protein